MPYVPRQPTAFAPMTQPLRPELNVQGTQPPQAKPMMPPLQKPERKRNAMTSRVSIDKFSVSPDRVFENLYGQEMKVNPVTGMCTNFDKNGTTAMEVAARPSFKEPDVREVFGRLFATRKA